MGPCEEDAAACAELFPPSGYLSDDSDGSDDYSSADDDSEDEGEGYNPSRGLRLWSAGGDVEYPDEDDGDADFDASGIRPSKRPKQVRTRSAAVGFGCLLSHL
jgi:hypothetical protein